MVNSKDKMWANYFWATMQWKIKEEDSGKVGDFRYRVEGVNCFGVVSVGCGSSLGIAYVNCFLPSENASRLEGLKK